VNRTAWAIVVGLSIGVVAVSLVGIVVKAVTP